MPDTVRQVPISDDRYRCSGAGTDSYPSSPAVSPSHSFKRSKSTFYLLDRRTSPPPGRLLQPQNVTAGTIHGFATFFWTMANALLGLQWVNVLLVRLPSLCLCLWLRCVWKCTRVPLVVSKHFLRLCIVSSSRDRFTVLINGGSTVQALHLARNFHQAGARVIVCEIDGRAELCSLSVAVDGHYTVPGPNDDNCVLYVDALRAIVERERVDVYVPTGATVSAYYDAVAKPHLELLGCRCWTPGLDGVAVLNDLSEVFRMCETVGLPVPKHLLVCSKDDVIKLYDNVSFRADRHFIVNVGQSGCKSGHSLQLPATRRSLRLPGPVSDDCPWLLVQHCLGSYYTTCTTVQAGRVVANVTFTAHDGQARDHNELIDDWTARFVVRGPGAVRWLPVVQGVRVAVKEGRASGLSRRRAHHVRFVPQQFRTRRYAVPTATAWTPFQRSCGSRFTCGCRCTCGCCHQRRTTTVHRAGRRNDESVLRDGADLRDCHPDDDRPVAQASRAHGGHETGNGICVLGPAAVFRPLQSADDCGPHKHRPGRGGDTVVVGPEKQIYHVLMCGGRYCIV
ncbi:unnamed protein product [Macrosiphum euphorbiae]|uniref:Uncharacterized protein n=1 Tax=Macrosiphum euphorbiae TaxID=13131 RepID=A0AAV0XK92_9HEMI|nr:unnamed protein product [Macrosiphum euphorbiae]